MLRLMVLSLLQWGENIILLDNSLGVMFNLECDYSNNPSDWVK